MDISDNDLIPERQLAARLGEEVRGRPFAITTLASWRRLHKGPPWARIGRDVVYRGSGVKQWLRDREARR
jgi:hypothetical protein